MPEFLHFQIQMLLSVLCMTFGVSLMASLVFEYPVFILEKLLWDNEKKNIEEKKRKI